MSGSFIVRDVISPQRAIQRKLLQYILEYLLLGLILNVLRVLVFNR
jgi:hypothetical protein